MELTAGKRLFDFDGDLTLDNLDDATTSVVLSGELRLGFAGLAFRAEKLGPLRNGEPISFKAEELTIVLGTLRSGDSEGLDIW